MGKIGPKKDCVCVWTHEAQRIHPVKWRSMMTGPSPWPTGWVAVREMALATAFAPSGENHVEERRCFLRDFAQDHFRVSSCVNGLSSTKRVRQIISFTSSN